MGANCVWSFAWVEDVAAAHVAALERGRAGARYFLGGENRPQMAAFEAVRDADRPPRCRAASPRRWVWRRA